VEFCRISDLLLKLSEFITFWKLTLFVLWPLFHLSNETINEPVKIDLRVK
jgi:hypothetical protein